MKKTTCANLSQYAPITTPADWDEPKDMEYYIGMHGSPDGECYAHLRDQIEGYYQDLHALLQNAIGYLLRKTNPPHPAPLAALSLPEMVERLLELLCQA